MKTRYLVAVFAIFALAIPAWAGVVIEVESNNLRSNQTTSSKIYAQGEMLRMEPGEEEEVAVIFRDNQMLVINHRERTYHRIDEQMLQQMSAQLSTVMKQMEEQLAGMPPEQREMVRRMMQQQMKGAPKPAAGSERPAHRIEEEGSDRVRDYDCRKYGVYRGQEKTQELCVVAPGELEGMEEAMQAFHAMARFSEKILESFQEGPFAEVIDNPFQFLHEIDGFPILSREFEEGRAVEETIFSSVARQNLSDDDFSPPRGYKLLDPFK